MSEPGKTVVRHIPVREETDDYGYVCTFPGRWATMQGRMHGKNQRAWPFHARGPTDKKQIGLSFCDLSWIDSPLPMPDLSLLSVWLHILAATVWIGGMAALALLLVPLLRQERFEEVATPLLYESALRFRWIGWGALGVLIGTGLINVRAQGVPWSAWLEPGFWTTAWGQALGWKLVLVVVTLGVSAVHDFHLGPRAIRLMQEAPESSEAERMRWWSSWLGRLTFLLSLAILWFAVLLPRGGL